MGTLFIVGTPIGNLEDISSRALDILRDVHLIASENPARTQRLLARYEIQTPMMRYTDAYQRKKRQRAAAVLDALQEGDVALVSEAGMPGLADPGFELIAAAQRAGSARRTGARAHGPVRGPLSGRHPGGAIPLSWLSAPREQRPPQAACPPGPQPLHPRSLRVAAPPARHTGCPGRPLWRPAHGRRPAS